MAHTPIYGTMNPFYLKNVGHYLMLELLCHQVYWSLCTHAIQTEQHRGPYACSFYIRVMMTSGCWTSLAGNATPSFRPLPILPTIPSDAPCWEKKVPATTGVCENPPFALAQWESASAGRRLAGHYDGDGDGEMPDQGHFHLAYPASPRPHPASSRLHPCHWASRASDAAVTPLLPWPAQQHISAHYHRRRWTHGWPGE
jgi:hypothetical protein